MELKDWIRSARKHKGWTQEQLGDAMGVTKGNVSGWENGRHEPGYSQLTKISSLTGYSMAYIDQDVRTGALVDEETTALRHELGERRAAYGMTPILAWEHEEDLPEGEFVMIPRLDVHLSAGNGAGTSQVEILFDEHQPQAFRADWIRRERLKPKRLAAMRARGDSMEQTIFDGDSLLVDTSQTEVVDSGVYALWYEGGERVKRLFRLPGGGLRIESDNPRYHPIELGPDYSGHVRIIGRVVHRSGTGGL